MDSKMVPSLFEEALFKQHQQESHYRFTLELGLFIALLLAFFMLGVNNLRYNTLFLDEAINSVVGEDFLHGVYTRNAMAFHFGSYLYPAVSTLLNRIGGVGTLRLASTYMMCIASIFIYFTARKLFGRRASLFSMMLFLFSGVILNLGQLAVYDSLALPFLAASLYFLVSASRSEFRQKYLLLAASVCAILSILSKYIGVIYLPALLITPFVLSRSRGMTSRQILSALSVYFLLPILFVLGSYGYYYRFELLQVFQNQGFSAAPRLFILTMIGQQIGIVLLLAAVGFAQLARRLISSRDENLPSLFWSQESRRYWESLFQSHRLTFFFLLVLLLGSWLAAPLQQLISGNVRSLWKNCAYSLVFLVPLASYALTTLVESLRSRSRSLAVNLLGVLILCLGIVYFADQALTSNWTFHQSWPNADGVISYLRESGLDRNSRVLAEGMDIYEYYFDFGTNDRQVWNNFWYMDYGGQSGEDGALAAIRDHVVDFVIIDDYYYPGIRARVDPVLANAGYVVGWQQQQELRSGETILLQVFIPGE